MTEEEINDLLNRYHTNQCTTEEKLKLEAWLDSYVNASDAGVDPDQIAALRSDTKRSIDLMIRKPSRFKINRVLQAAALLLLLVSIGWLWRSHFIRTNDSHDATGYKLLSVVPGKKMKLVLSDGTTVIASGGSKLEYPEFFDRKTRRVLLIEGEAYFDVKQESNRPFIVDAPNSRIHVLGTAFNVRAFKSLNSVQVTVTSGKVSVTRTDRLAAASNHTVILLPDEQASINIPAGTMQKKHVNAVELSGWTNGKYKFDNETLENVSVMVESYYDVKILFATEELKNIRFTSQFEQADKLEDLLFTICAANHLSYRKNGKEIILTSL